MAERNGAFWGAALGAPLAILSDFDFTISAVDVGDLITDTFCPPSPEVLARIARGEAGSRLYWLDSMARVEREQAVALASQVEIDPGFHDLVAWAAIQAVPLAVVSDGFTFYIERILGREGLSHLPVFANEHAGPGELAFPFANPACDLCGCCKAAIARRLKESGTKIIYLGDGVSDLYAAGFADWVFAKGRLAQHMEEHGAPYFPLESFHEVLALLQPNLERFRTGAMSRRNSLTANPRCRFA